MEFAQTLDTERLVLSPVGWSDAAFFVGLLGHPHVRQFLGGPVSLYQRLSRFGAYRRGQPGAGIWIVRARVTRTRLGLIELRPHKDGAAYEVAYQFHPQSWGTGSARAALSRVLAHAQDDLGLSRVIAETQVANAPSRRLLEGLGFVEERRLERFGDLQVLLSLSW